MNTTMAAPPRASTVPAPPQSRRFEVSPSADLVRIRGEYLEMPGLALTLPQAARLWWFSTRRATELLTVLVDGGFLVCDKKTVYRRRR
jgi:hypothetical protein